MKWCEGVKTHVENFEKSPILILIIKIIAAKFEKV